MTDTHFYTEELHDEFGVEYKWNNAQILDTKMTKRGTYVEFVERPKWGVACYMNNSIQSCVKDERLYHESLVHPVLSSVKIAKHICIIGGGEGATAREVLRFPGVERVDMFEWDEEVVLMFKEKYPQWAQGAWHDSRLFIHYENIFDVIKTFKPTEKYDAVIIDLFEPSDENHEQWTTLLNAVHNWVNPEGSIVMYAGMRNILAEQQPYERLKEILVKKEQWRAIEIYSFDKEIVPYRVWIPSFSGESMFLLVKPFENKVNFETLKGLKSHISEPVWNSYKTLNWY